jgi:hypothetical protein
VRARSREHRTKKGRTVKEYDVTASSGFETTLLLDDEDAAAQELSGGRDHPDYVGPDINAPVSDDDDESSKSKKSSASNKADKSSSNK